jgi:predicted nucleic acid-binding protein
LIAFFDYAYGSGYLVELALNGNAGVLVTFNTRDFQLPEMLPRGLDIVTPGAFVKKYPV